MLRHRRALLRVDVPDDGRGVPGAAHDEVAAAVEKEAGDDVDVADHAGDGLGARDAVHLDRGDKWIRQWSDLETVAVHRFSCILDAISKSNERF